MSSCSVAELHPKIRLSADAFGPREFGLMMEGSSDAAILTARDGRILYVNRAFEEMTGYAREEAIGRTPAILKSGQQSSEFYQLLWNTLRAGRQFTGVLVNRRNSGELFHEEKAIWPLVDAYGGVTHYISIGRDVSQKMASMEQLVHAATHDSLTDLPNRALFMDRLEQALRHARRTGERLLVALLDVDRFKTVNDSLGHQTGDALLREIAVRLRRSVREEDTVARLGGDEFAMVLPGVINAEGGERILAKIAASFTSPIAISHRMLRTSVSLGGCLGTGPPWEQEGLLALADQALYCVKHGGGNGFLLQASEAQAEDFERGHASDLKELTSDLGANPGFSARHRSGRAMSAIEPNPPKAKDGLRFAAWVGLHTPSEPHYDPSGAVGSSRSSACPPLLRARYGHQNG